MLDTEFKFQPVIIIGAARSGTNMLRNLLTKLDKVGTWPCDEINYIWRYGHAKFPTDELQPEQADRSTKNYIRRCFNGQAKRTGSQWLVEKTCANSLRVDYVDTIVPEAKYLFLVRNGVDVVASAEKRWHAPLDFRYLTKKAAYIPWRDIPHYGARYLSHRIERMQNHEKKLPTWGPKFSGMSNAISSMSSKMVCAMQWQRSVETAAHALNRMAPGRVYPMSYEAFVHSPGRELPKILDFLKIHYSEDQCEQLAGSILSKSVGVGRAAIDKQELAKIEPLVKETQSMLASKFPALGQSFLCNYAA